MDPLLIRPSEPQWQLCGLTRQQCTTLYWNVHHTGELAENLGRNQNLRSHRVQLWRRGQGFIRRAVLSWGGSKWGHRGGGLAAEGEEIRVRGHNPQATQSNTADVAEFNVGFSDLAAQQSSGELQEEDLQTQRFIIAFGSNYFYFILCIYSFAFMHLFIYFYKNLFSLADCVCAIFWSF